MNEELKSIKDLLKAISESSDTVFIVGHDKSDLDALASAIGLQVLCENLGKKAYIVLDEIEETMDPIVKKIRNENSEKYNIIDLLEYELLRNKQSTLIVTDTNKMDKIVLRENLDDFSQIIVIDHHATGETTIKDAKTFIPQSDISQSIKVSSASEIVAQLLLQAKVECESDVYTYLYGGIYLDTNRFDKNVGEKTHDTAHKLCAKGADTFAVKELFLADFDEDKIINELVFNGTLLKVYTYNALENYTIGFTLNREKPETIYKKESLAKAADRMMQYRIDAEFAMGYIDSDTVKVSARSRGKIDVSKVMEYVGGGGNSQNAGTQIQGLPLTTLEDILLVAIEKGIPIRDEIAYPTDSAIISSPKQYKKNKQT